MKNILFISVVLLTSYAINAQNVFNTTDNEAPDRESLSIVKSLESHENCKAISGNGGCKAISGNGGCKAISGNGGYKTISRNSKGYKWKWYIIMFYKRIGTM